MRKLKKKKKNIYIYFFAKINPRVRVRLTGIFCTDIGFSGLFFVQKIQFGLNGHPKNPIVGFLY